MSDSSRVSSRLLLSRADDDRAAVAIRNGFGDRLLREAFEQPLGEIRLATSSWTPPAMLLLLVWFVEPLYALKRVPGFESPSGRREYGDRARSSCGHLVYERRSIDHRRYQ